MDPSANLSDSRPESLTTLSDTSTEEMESSFSHKPTYVKSLVYKRHAEAVTDPRKNVPKPLSCMNKSVSKRPGIETMADPDCLTSFSSLADCGFLEDHANLQPAPSGVICRPKKSDLSVHKNSAPSTSDSPQITHSLTSTPSCQLTVPFKTLPDLYHKEHAVHYSLKQGCSTSEVHRISSMSLTDRPDQSDRSDPEAVLNPCSLTHDNNNTDPSTVLSHLSSGLTESDSMQYAVEPLFIIESDTQDFLNLSSQPNPALDHHFPSDRPSAFPQILECNTHIPSEHILPGAVTQYHNHSFTKLDLDSNSEHIGQEPPTGTDNAGKDGMPVGEAESASHVNSQAVQSDHPIDQWMDACQYLAGEDKRARKLDSEGTILDLWGSSVLREEEDCTDITTLSWPCPSADAKVSGYPSTEEGDAIRRASCGDIEGVWGAPHIERWSSVESWETALSDWAAIIASPPEEITAAFTEIGAEIDALTQALARDSEARMAVASPVETPGGASMQEDPFNRGIQVIQVIQDQTLDSQSRPDLCVSPGGSSSTITSPNTPTDPSIIKEFLEVKLEGSRASPREENKDAGETNSTLDQDTLAYPVDTSMTLSCVTLTTLGECSTDISTSAMIPGSPRIPAVLEESGPDLCQFWQCVDLMDRDGDTSNEEDAVLLHIEEDVDKDLETESTLSGLNIEEPHGGDVYKVTEEDNVSQQDLSVKDRDLRHDESELTDSHPTGGESETVESEAAGEDLYHFNDTAHALRNTNVPLDTKADLLGNADKQASHDTSLHQNVLSGEDPNSGSPAAPLAIGRPLLSVTNGLEGDQDCAQVEVFTDNKEPSCPHTKTCVPLPALEVTGKSPRQGHPENKTESTDETEHSNSDVQHSPQELKEELQVCLDNDLLNRGVCHLGDDAEDRFTADYNSRNITQEINILSRDLANLVAAPGDHYRLSEKSHVAYFTIDLVDPFFPKAIKDTAPPGLQNSDRPRTGWEKHLTMPHKTHRSNLDFKTRPKKDKCATGLHPATPTCKRQENLTAHIPVQQPTKVHDNHTKRDSLTGLEGNEDSSVTAGNSAAVSDALDTKSHGKKKKKHTTQNATVVKSEPEPPSVKEENGGKQKAMAGKISVFEAKFVTKIGKTKDKLVIPGKLECVQLDGVQKKSQHPEVKACPVKEPPNGGTHLDLQKTAPTNLLNDDAVKRRRLSENKFGKMVSALESKLTKAEVSMAPKREEAKSSMDTTRRKAYSEVVKQKTPREGPKVEKEIQAESVSGDPLSLCLWCQFSAVFADHTITWSREGSTLSELKRSGGDESRVSVTIPKASQQDLGKYTCVLTSLHGSLCLDYLLTYEVLSEIVIPATPKTIPSSHVDIVGNEENVHCSRLLFKEDFLSQQYFGENEAASIVTEEVHFGEGMHRRAFRTKLQAGRVPQLEPGNTCVLKVHNSISYGTKSNDELVQKNFNLAVEECQVQNTAREYIKAYTTVAQSAEAFGEVPEIIPIYLVHRPSNDVPYATLEEELVGDFVKYSVRDGKEINLMRRDSEAGQKCCAFQHWVYHKTEGNLLVTDMQGVGMRLTDVGIATCKKGYKGFRGNCATSFIDQFKALHMCNKYCEILGLASLQPKPKKSFSAPKPKPQPPSATPKKKTFGPTVKGKT